MKRRIFLTPFLLAVVVLAGVCGGCARPEAQSGSGPASDRMGSLAGMPVEPGLTSGGASPNPAAMIDAGQVAAANAEASSLKIAARAYIAARRPAYRFTSDDLYPQYTSVMARACYHFDPVSLQIRKVDPIPGGWAGMVFSLSEQRWRQGTPDNDRPDDQDVP